MNGQMLCETEKDVKICINCDTNYIIKCVIPYIHVQNNRTQKIISMHHNDITNKNKKN